jgi:hypothetical protein
MNRKRQSLERIDQNRRAETLKATPAITATPTAEYDAHQLAREAYQAFAEELERYRNMGVEKYLNPREIPKSEVEEILALPPHELTFTHLEHLSRVDPASAFARWEEMRTAAREDLINGRIAAYVVEHVGGSAWERAMFLAVREQLYRAWRPRHGGEALLLDEMAQYEMIRQRWMCVISHWSREPTMQQSLRDPDYMRFNKRQINAAEANMEAMRMVERLQRLYQNALRTLLMSRRSKSAFIVQRSGQVNLALGAQVNGCVAAPSEPEEVESAKLADDTSG